MLQLLLAAPSSGSGKTTAACALLSALKARGLEPCAFKCGPDYIDPMFHRAVLGVPSHNLDLFLSTPQTVRRLYTSGAAGHGSAVCEGAMGYYDGLGGVSAAASAWHTADVLDLPVLLVVRPKGASLTLAAQLQGLKAFRTPHHMAGVLLNDCTEMLYKLLAPMLERETGLPVVGFLLGYFLTEGLMSEGWRYAAAVIAAAVFFLPSVFYDRQTKKDGSLTYTILRLF